MFQHVILNAISSTVTYSDDELTCCFKEERGINMTYASAKLDGHVVSFVLIVFAGPAEQSTELRLWCEFVTSTSRVCNI